MLSNMSLGDAMKVALKYDLTKKVERTLDLGNDNDIIPEDLWAGLQSLRAEVEAPIDQRITDAAAWAQSLLRDVREIESTVPDSGLRQTATSARLRDCAYALTCGSLCTAVDEMPFVGLGAPAMNLQLSPTWSAYSQTGRAHTHGSCREKHTGSRRSASLFCEQDSTAIPSVLPFLFPADG